MIYYFQMCEHGRSWSEVILYISMAHCGRGDRLASNTLREANRKLSGQQQQEITARYLDTKLSCIASGCASVWVG